MEKGNAGTGECGAGCKVDYPDHDDAIHHCSGVIEEFCSIRLDAMLI